MLKSSLDSEQNGHGGHKEGGTYLGGRGEGEEIGSRVRYEERLEFAESSMAV